MRKHLHYSPEEWDALPWWQQRMFLAGLKRELAPPGSEVDPDMSEDDKAQLMGFRIE